MDVRVRCKNLIREGFEKNVKCVITFLFLGFFHVLEQLDHF